jgi:hypothetical protein
LHDERGGWGRIAGGSALLLDDNDLLSRFARHHDDALYEGWRRLAGSGVRWIRGEVLKRSGQLRVRTPFG